MNQEQLKKFEKTLHRSCKNHLANGGTLIRGRYWDGTDCHACPIRATVLPIPSRNFFMRFWYVILALFGKTMTPKLGLGTLGASYAVTLSEAMGFKVSPEELSYFVHGYDSQGVGYCCPDDEFGKLIYKLGQKFNEIYHPISIM